MIKIKRFICVEVFKLKKKIVIHVGYPKTGTTTLQKHFFPKVENYTFIGRCKSEEYMDRYKLIASDSFINLILEDFVDFNQNRIKDTILNHHSTSFIISEENFLALSFRENLFKGRRVVPDFLLSAKKLRDVFDLDKFDVKIIFTIRRQQDLIPSLYAQSYTKSYSKSSEYNSFAKFLSYFETKRCNELNKLIDFNFVVDEYIKLFGYENIKVYLAEELFENPELFYKNLIYDFGFNVDLNEVDFKVKENVRFESGYRKADNLTLVGYLRHFKSNYFPESRIKIPRLAKKHLDKLILKNNDSFSKTIILDNDQKKKIKENYLESNKEISKKLKLSLKNYDYFL